MAQSQSNSRKKVWVACGLAVGLGAFAMFNGLPHHSSASDDNPLDEYALYGIGSQSGSLMRYQFSDGKLSTVGTISDGTTTMTGIQASAYVPRNSNIFTFWNDPSDGQTKLVYVNTNSAKAVVVGNPMGTGAVTAAVATMPNPSTYNLTPDQQTPAPDIIKYGIYAVKTADAIPFDIVDDEMVPATSFATKITVLGSAISYGGLEDCPVTVKINVGSDTMEPWGTYSKPVNGNVNADANDETGKNNGLNPRSYIMPNTYATGTPISISGKSWYRDSGSGTQNSDWSGDLTVDSSTNTPQLITLRNGDAVPNIDGFKDQASLTAFIADYIDTSTNTVVLGPTQAIYLFELGTTDLSSSAADFQDLVVLVTLGKNAADLDGVTRNVVIIDEDAISNGISTVVQAASDHGVTPDHLVNTDIATETGNPVLRWSDLYSGGTVVLPSGQTGDEGFFFLPNNPPFTVEDYVDGVVPQSQLVPVSGVNPLDNDELAGMVGKSWVGVVHESDVSVNPGNANLQGKRRGLFYFTVLEVRPPGNLPETGSSSSLYEVVVRIDPVPAPASTEPVAHLVNVNPRDAMYTPVMPLSRVYDGLAATSAQKFYGTYNGELYAIDPSAGTETLIGTLPYSQNVEAFEAAGNTFYGFTDTANQLRAIDTTTGQIIGADINTGITDLGSLTMVRLADEPQLRNFD